MRPTLAVILVKLEQFEDNQTIHRGIILEKLKELDDDIKKLNIATNDRLIDIEDNRLLKLEHWKSRISGVLVTLGVIGTIAGVIGGIIVQLINKDQIIAWILTLK